MNEKDFLDLVEKYKKKKKTNTTNNTETATNRATDKDAEAFFSLVDQYKEQSLSNRLEALFARDTSGNSSLTDKVKEEEKKVDDSKLDFLQASGDFDDGYNFGDVSKTILGTAGDAVLNVGKGAGSLVEGVADLGMYAASAIANQVQGDDLETEAQMKAQTILDNMMSERDFNAYASRLGHKGTYQEYVDGVKAQAQEILDNAQSGGVAASIKEKAQKNTVDDVTKGAQDFLDAHSVLGRTSKGVFQGVGQVGGMLATGGLGAATGIGGTAATTATSLLSSWGNNMSQAYQEGASDADAWTYGAIAGAVDAGTELIFGGLGKGINAVGYSKGLTQADDILAKKVTNKITNQIAKNFAEYGIKAGAEGFEEVLAGTLQAITKGFTYKETEEEWTFENIGETLKHFANLIEDENLLEQFVVGAVTSGIAQSGYVPGMQNGSLREANKAGKDFITGQTQNEQAVIKRETEKRIAEAEQNGTKLTGRQKSSIEAQVESDLEKGYISTDTIEEVLGGDTYNSFKENVEGFMGSDTYKEYNKAVEEEKSLRQEFEELQKVKLTEADLGQQSRFTEVKNRLEEIKKESKSATLRKELDAEIERINGLKNTLRQEVSEKVKNERLSESYRELQRSTEKFQADPAEYDNEYARKTVANIVKSGIANNTNETHEFVSMMAKISADKGVVFSLTDAERLAGTRYAKDGATTNAYVTSEGDIVINNDSKKRLNSLVGHEVTHVLEGSQLYGELQKAVFDYAQKKGDYDSRLKAITDLYQKYDPKADPKKELTADLVGDYLFTDKDFINKLSTDNRNVFQKIYDEIKYLFKVATAGSKEARALEKAKKMFEAAYRENVKGKPQAETNFSLERVGGTEYVKADKSFFEKEDGTLATEKEVFDSLVGQTIHLPDGDVKVVKSLPKKNMYKELYKRQPKYKQNVDDIKKLNSDVNYNMEELLTNSKAVNVNKPDVDNRHKDQGIVAFDTRKVKFYDGSKAFNIEFSIGVLENGEKIAYAKKFYGYDAELTKKIQAAETSGSTNTTMNQKSVSSNIIPQNSEKSTGEAKKSLTPEQEEYFKDSVVRDENGNLKPMYHGTSQGGHTMFDPYGKAKYGLFGTGTYFTDSKTIAESYTTKGKGKAPQVYETYLNITNPIDMDAQADPAAWRNALPEADFPEAGTNEQFYRAMEDYFEDMEYARWEASEVAMGVIEDMGYDGITHIGGGRVNADGERHQVYIAFRPEQIKNIDNASPTSDPDIRYSLSEDSEGRELSPAVQSRFGNSKAVDENGNLKVLYHGTASGEFSIFDKSKGSVEGDFGSGFYFTDNEADVSNNYEGGGPDFENKIARRAEQIEADEEIDYDEAEERAREELYKGSHKFEVYLNIENPAIVGETILFDNEAYLENYNEEDFDDYDDYIAEVEQLLADDIENIVWEVERTTGAYSTDGLADVLYNAYYDGGIGIEELKANINELYLEDENGNLIGNEVARQVIESLGYDGIIDPTVSTKWNMDMEEGTTHYIVFKPNQIKAVTNQTPTDNPDIHKSLSAKGDISRKVGGYAVYGDNIRVRDKTELDFAPIKEAAPVQEDIAPVREAAPEDIGPVRDTAPAVFPDDGLPGAETDIDSLTDADVPPEVDAPYYDDADEVTPADPFANRDIKEVGNRKVNAYMYENPEVKPFFQEEANMMLGELERTTKGERFYNMDVYYDTNGEAGITGTSRRTSQDIAYLLDELKYSYKQIEAGLKAIIEDNGKENNAVSKRIEFLLNDRLMNGYQDPDYGWDYPPNQDYINLLNEKQITEYNEEARNALFASGDEYAPIVDAPVAKTVPADDIGPVAYEAIRPQPDDIGPVAGVEYGDKLVRRDSNNGRPGEKERKWVGTSTDSEAVGRKVLPDDLNQDTIHYQPIPNKETLGKANSKLDGMGYEKSVTYFNSKFADRKTSLEDIALGERLIQEAVKRGDTKTAGELIQEVAILGTELGQKVQALSIIKRLTPEGQLQMLQRVVERGKTKGDKAYDGVEFTEEMVDKILAAYGKDGTYDQDKLNKAVEDVKQQIADQMKVTAMDKVNAWRYLSMLGNPKTHIRNLVSNVAMRGTVAVKNTLARTIETFAPIGNRTKTWKGASDDVKAFARNTAAEMKDILSDDGKYSEDATIKEKRQIFKNKILNGVYEFNSDLLTKEDWWFSKPAFINSLSEFLTANGISTKEDIQNNPDLVEKAKLYATEQSQIATFRQYTWLASKINDIERHNTATNIAVGAVLPFKKTPINIAKAGLNYSPLGFAKTLTYDIAKVKSGKMEASTMIDHLAQNITGSALTLLGYALAQAGFISGGGEDDKEGKFDYQLGAQSYAVNIGGRSYSLSWLSPVAMPLFVGANAYEQLVEGKEWNGDVVVETLAQTLDPLNEMSFLSGLNSVLSSYDSGMQKFAGIGEAMVQNYATQFVPTLSSQVATVIDDKKRSTKVSGDSGFAAFEGIINKLKYKIPGLRQTLEPSTDIWGNEVKQTENVMQRAYETFLAPYATKGDISTAVDEEIKTVYGDTGDTGVIPNIPYNYVNYKGEKYKMSASEFTDYKKMYGQLSYDLLGDLFDNQSYINASESEKADMIGKVYDYARDEAKKRLLAAKGVNYTNTTSDGNEVYKEDSIKGAIDNDMAPDEYSFYRDNPEKYDFLKSLNVSYTDYSSADDDTKEAYNWAYNNPEGYAVSKAVSSDIVEYKQYTKALNELKADKDASGKTISGSRKEKVLEYIGGLDLELGQKLILMKSEYNADDTFNYEIVEYLNGREDLSYEDVETILKKLGFNVSANGSITW